jgi:hypothetical protein
VVWSNVLAYHDVTLAPRAQLVELEQIGREFSGQGPTLLNEFSPYGVRHFLRNMDAESPRSAEYARSAAGRNAPAAGDDRGSRRVQLDGLLLYRTIVLRRSATASRPPAVYQLVSTKRHYDVWQRLSNCEYDR